MITVKFQNPDSNTNNFFPSIFWTKFTEKQDIIIIQGVQKHATNLMQVVSIKAKRLGEIDDTCNYISLVAPQEFPKNDFT